MQLSAYAKQEVIKVGYFEAIPFVFKNKYNKPDGVLYDKLLNNLNLGENYKVEFYEFPLARAFFELSKENIDILSLVTEQSFIEMKVTHRSIAICNIQEYIFVPKESNINIFVDSRIFKNKVIGLRAGVNLPDYFDSKKNNITYAETSGDKPIEKILMKLIKNRIDIAYFTNPKVGYLEAKKLGILNKIKVIKLGNHYSSLYLGFSRKFDKKMILQINEKIQREQKNLEVICSLN